MISSNLFFKKQNHVYLSKILKLLGLKNIKKDIKIKNIKDLASASTADISFFNSVKYLELLKKLKQNILL